MAKVLEGCRNLRHKAEVCFELDRKHASIYLCQLQYDSQNLIVSPRAATKLATYRNLIITQGCLLMRNAWRAT